jgi:hypothetical protein
MSSHSLPSLTFELLLDRSTQDVGSIRPRATTATFCCIAGTDGSPLWFALSERGEISVAPAASESGLGFLSIAAPVCLHSVEGQTMGKGLLLWLLGIPIPVIILLYLFHVV